MSELTNTHIVWIRPQSLRDFLWNHSNRAFAFFLRKVLLILTCAIAGAALGFFLNEFMDRQYQSSLTFRVLQNSGSDPMQTFLHSLHNPSNPNPFPQSEAFWTNFKTNLTKLYPEAANLSNKEWQRRFFNQFETEFTGQRIEIRFLHTDPKFAEAVLSVLTPLLEAHTLPAHSSLQKWNVFPNRFELNALENKYVELKLTLQKRRQGEFDSAELDRLNQQIAFTAGELLELKSVLSDPKELSQNWLSQGRSEWQELLSQMRFGSPIPWSSLALSQPVLRLAPWGDGRQFWHMPALGALVGFVLGAVVAFSLRFDDELLASVNELEKDFALPLLGVHQA